jgi:hypothetical protein
MLLVGTTAVPLREEPTMIPHSTPVVLELVRQRQEEVRYEVRGHRRRKAG